MCKPVAKRQRFFYAVEENCLIVRNTAGKPLHSVSTVRAYTTQAERDAFVNRGGGPMRRAIPAAEVTDKKFDFVRCMACYSADYGDVDTTPEDSSYRFGLCELGGETDWNPHVRDCHTK